MPDPALTTNCAVLRHVGTPRAHREILPGAQGVTIIIIFTATLCLIITVVVALAGVAANSGSIHSPGGDFVLSGHQLSSLSAGKLFRLPIVVRIAGLLGFSMLLGACSWRLTSRGPQPVLTNPAARPRRCAWTATGSPANPSSAREPTPGGLGEVLHAAAKQTS